MIFHKPYMVFHRSGILCLYVYGFRSVLFGAWIAYRSLEVYRMVREYVDYMAEIATFHLTLDGDMERKQMMLHGFSSFKDADRWIRANCYLGSIGEIHATCYQGTVPIWYKIVRSFVMADLNGKLELREN